MSIYTLGIDIGSTASKCIILKDGKDIVAKSLVDVGAGTTGPARALSEVLDIDLDGFVDLSCTDDNPSVLRRITDGVR